LADKTKLAVIAAIVIVAAAAAYLFLAHRGAPAATATAPATEAGQTTASTNSSASIVNADSLDDCEGDNVVVVVYAEGQEKLAEKIASLLQQQLAGHVPQGTVFCTAPAGSSGLADARVLPLILVKASNTSAKLEQLLLNETIVDGYRPIRYDVDAVFAVQVAARFGLPKPVYNAEAEAVIVEPQAAVARLEPEQLQAQRQLLELVEAVFAAKITRVTAADTVEGFSRDTRPGLVLRSSVDLTDGDPAVARIGDNLYEAREIDFARVFMQRGLVEAIEYEKSADELDLVEAAERHPAIGSGPVHVAVFEDFMCPFCAKFYNETLPWLEQQAARGVLTLHFMDLIVHQQGVVPKLHRLLLCYFIETHDAEGYVDAVKEIYRLLLVDLEKLQKEEINETALLKDYDMLYEKLREKLGIDENCTEAPKLITESTRIAQKLGLTGTPSFAAWREGGNYVIVTEGFRTQQFFEKLLDSLKG